MNNFSSPPTRSPSALERQAGLLTFFTCCGSDFSIALGTPTANVLPAQSSISYPVTVTSIGGWAGTVHLSVGAPQGSNMSAGVTWQFSPSSVLLSSGGTASSTLTLNSTAATPGGSFPLVLTGARPSDNYTKTANFSLGTQVTTFAVNSVTGSGIVHNNGQQVSITNNVTSSNTVPSSATTCSAPAGSGVTCTTSFSGSSVILSMTAPCGTQASDSFTFALGNDTTVIAWVDASKVPIDASQLSQTDPVFQGLEGSDPVTLLPNCPLTLAKWLAGGEAGIGAGTGPGGNGFSPAEVLFANQFLIHNSANAAPPSSLAPDQSGFLASKQFRLYTRYQQYYELTPQSAISWIPNAGILKATAVPGVTPEPCFGTPTQLFSLAAEQNPLNPQPALTQNGYWAYLLNQGRLGQEGQAVNQFLNGPPNNPDYTTSTPWIWSAIQFDSNGKTQAFTQNTTSSTTQNLSIFPTYWVYTNGYLAYRIPQSDVSAFIDQNSTFQHTGPK